MESNGKGHGRNGRRLLFMDYCRTIKTDIAKYG